MSEKRFTVPSKYSLSHSKIQCDGEPLTNDELVRILNTNDGAFLENFNLKKENEQLKQAYQTLKHRHSLLHDECLEAECDRDSLKKDVISLEKENEQLKKEIEEHKAVINREWKKYLKKHEMI